jgi:hypothetical protein
VEHVISEVKEYAEPVLFSLHSVGSTASLQLGLVSIVVFNGCHFLVICYVKVVVEIAAKGRKPGKFPTFFRL